MKLINKILAKIGLFGLYATTSTSVVTEQAVATTNTIQRTVSDEIRMLFPKSAVLTQLISSGSVGETRYTAQKSLIGKKSVDTLKYEVFTYTPLAIELTASLLSSTTLTVGSSTGVTAYMTLFNTENFTTARVESVTNSTTIEITSFGSTAFSLVGTAAKLLVCAPAYPQGSSSPAIISKDDDQVYNVLQTVRFPITIARETKDSPHYIGNYWKRMKLINNEEAARKLEYTLLFGNRPSSGITTSGGATLTDAFHTTRGLLNWAVNSSNAGGNFTYEYLIDDLVRDMGTLVDNSKTYVALGSQKMKGKLLRAMVGKWTPNDSGSYAKFGIKSDKFLTSGPDIEFISHEAMSHGNLENQMIVFQPEAVTYVYKKGLDLKPYMNIQANDAFAQTDEIAGCIGLQAEMGGNHITRAYNLF